MRTRGLVIGLSLVVAGFLVGACGDSGSSSTTNDRPVAPGARVVEVTAKSFSFSPTTITIQAGENVAIKLSSDDSFHDFHVDGSGTIVSVNGGQTKSGGLRIAKAGTYTFYCTVPGHRAAGMEGKIVVQ